MHDSNHQSLHINRRFVALIGIGASLIIILGIIVFNAHAGTIPGMMQSSTNSVKSALNLTPIHNECHNPPHKIGDETLSIQSGGLSRTFIVHLAPSYGYQPQALVMNYHGYQNTALRTAQRTNMGIEADRAGFILVFPQGVDNPPSWNAHDQRNPASKVIFKKADVTALEWAQCAPGSVIQHYRISDGGHVWPGSNPTLGIGYNSHTIDASVVIWNFLSQFSN